MSITRDNFIDILEEIVLMLELKGENPFKIRAYRNGAEIIRNFEGDIVALAQENELKGIILLNDVRKLIFKPELYEKEKVRYFMKRPPTTIDINEAMEAVMNKFEQTSAWNLPVTVDGKYYGFLSKSKILSSYRNELRRQSKGLS